MKVVLSHFFNEEYLLPWWLMHHRKLFDHGVLIDYHSTDRSVEICRELAPDWEIITTENDFFSAINCDFEIMKHEERFPEAWKIALNTTEFLCGDQLDDVISKAVEENKLGVSIPGAAMVDNQPDKVPDPSLPLVTQKHHGFWESEFPASEVKYPWFFPKARTRLLHRFRFGAYTPGRHSSMLPNLMPVTNAELGIWWYGYSPWTPEFVRRKTQVQTKMDPMDKRAGFGRQHIATEQEQSNRHAVLLNHARDLMANEDMRSNTSLIGNILAERDQAMAERDQAVADRDRAVADRDRAVADRDRAVADRDHSQRYPWKNIGKAMGYRFGK